MATGTQVGGCKILWATATVDFGSTATLVGTDSSAITVTGAALGDLVVVGQATAPDTSTCLYGFVSAADAVKVRFCNFSAGTIDPASQVLTVGVVKLSPNVT